MAYYFGRTLTCVAYFFKCPNESNYVNLCSGQILCQIFGFLDLFVLLGSTFLFRHGLLGILGSQFKHILCLHPVYTAATIALGIIRIVRLDSTKPRLSWPPFLPNNSIPASL